MGIKNLWIFLHVGPNTPAQREIEFFASQVSQHAADATWFALHSAALSPYLGSWHSYVNYLGFKVDHFVCLPETLHYRVANRLPRLIIR